MKERINYFLKQYIEYDSDASVKDSFTITDSSGRFIKLSQAEVDSYLIPKLKQLSKSVHDFYTNRYLEKKKADFDKALAEGDKGELAFFCIRNRREDTNMYICQKYDRECVGRHCTAQELNWRYEP